MTASFLIRRVLKTPEWSINYMKVPPGEMYKTHRSPGITENALTHLSIPGKIVDIPRETAQLQKFKERYQLSNYLGSDATQAFIPANVTIVAMARGEFEYMYKDENGGWLPSTTEYPGSALPVYVATSPNSFQKNVKGSISYCCGPTELMLHWDRKVMTLVATDKYVVPVRTTARHRFILAEGTVVHNSTEVSGPAVLTVSAGDIITASGLVYCAEVWVEPTE